MIYYAIEGLDRSGKSYIWDALYHRLKDENYLKPGGASVMRLDAGLYDRIKAGGTPPDVLFVREPSALHLGEIARRAVCWDGLQDPAGFFLMQAQRAELLDFLRPLPSVVISDRCLISGVAYSIDIPVKEALEIGLLATKGRLPSLVVMLNANLENIYYHLEKTILAKVPDAVEKRGRAYYAKVAERYKEVLHLLKNEYNIVIKELGGYEEGGDRLKEAYDFFNIPAALDSISKPAVQAAPVKKEDRWSYHWLAAVARYKKDLPDILMDDPLTSRR